MPPKSTHSAKDVDNLVDSYERKHWCISDPMHLSMGHVMFLMKTKGNAPRVADAIASLHGYTSAAPSSFRIKADVYWKKLKKMKRSVQRTFDAIERFLSSPFVLPKVFNFFFSSPLTHT